MIFAETERLYLRALEKEELPRLVQLLDVWDVVRWMSVIPFPYTMKDGENFYSTIIEHYAKGEPQFYTLALKSDNVLIGGIGLHPPRNTSAKEGEIETGYWLSKDFWGQGLMGEAAQEAIKIGFARPTVKMIGATTAINNIASQNVLRKAGLRHMGIVPRTYQALRGDDQVVKWLLTREEYEQEVAA